MAIKYRKAHKAHGRSSLCGLLQHFCVSPFHLGGNYDSHFDVDKGTGTIIVAKPLDAEQKSNYNLTVEATDGTTTILTQVSERGPCVCERGRGRCPPLGMQRHSGQLGVDVVYTCTRQEFLGRDRKRKSRVGFCLLCNSLIKISIGECEQ